MAKEIKYGSEARAALGAGVDAPTAVEVAKRYDLYSGGQTQSLKLF